MKRDPASRENKGVRTFNLSRSDGFRSQEHTKYKLLTQLS